MPRSASLHFRCALIARAPLLRENAVRDWEAGFSFRVWPGRQAAVATALGLLFPLHTDVGPPYTAAAPPSRRHPEATKRTGGRLGSRIFAAAETGLGFSARRRDRCHTGAEHGGRQT